MAIIDLNNPLTSLDDSDNINVLSGLNGRVIDYGNFKNQIINNSLATFYPTTYIIRSSEDLESTFDPLNTGVYTVPPNSAIRQLTPFLVINKPFVIQGAFYWKGISTGTGPSIGAINFDGVLFNSTSTALFWIDQTLFSPLSMFDPSPAPNLNATFLNIVNPSIAQYSLALYTLAIVQGFGDLGAFEGFDFCYARELIANLNLNGLKFKKINLLDALSYKWQYGLGNGIALEASEISNGCLSNFLLSLNPSEYAFKITDPTNTLQRFKVGVGLFDGTASQGFEPGSLDQTDPRVYVTGFAPIPDSTVYAQLSAPAFTETIAVANNFYPIQSQLSIIGNNAERLIVEGTGDSTRLVCTSKNRVNLEVSAEAGLTGSTGSTALAIALGKNLGNSQGGVNFNDPIPTSDTANYNLVASSISPANVLGGTRYTSRFVFQMEEGDYIKLYKRSSTTANVTASGYSLIARIL
jgi:hypothetical protein